MEKKTIKALFVNGGPRKNKNRASSESHQACLNGRVAREEGIANTAQMLISAMQGAKDAGAETEMAHLYDIDFKGCKSCFACQLKNAKTDGVCAIRDGLCPLLEKAREADVIVIGSPVYFSYPTARHARSSKDSSSRISPTTTTNKAIAVAQSVRSRPP